MPASDEPANPDSGRDDEPDERREVWTYAGIRWDGKLHYAWWDDSELLHYRKRLVTVAVGGQAELSVRRSDDLITVMTGPAQPNRALATPVSTTPSWFTGGLPPASPPWLNVTRSASTPWTTCCGRCSTSRRS
ncbi:hypothetical protein [Lentzea flava]|uniref:Uncharacterized protein n=1 Tax=Lentzea flava TaxID=103732 RepID=A0ABQ2UZB5_9PSEU|nr:hypothetical protein [Lentzea flava]MCP2202437.1 hypothetical protein [Lentzea flava]GGU59080.1 hypothetical protein GCM10010178_59110 [Lentzea flava]